MKLDFKNLLQLY